MLRPLRSNVELSFPSLPELERLAPTAHQLLDDRLEDPRLDPGRRDLPSAPGMDFLSGLQQQELAQLLVDWVLNQRDRGPRPSGGGRNLGSLGATGNRGPIAAERVGPGERLDTPGKVRGYIEGRTGDLPPTAQSLEQLAKEITERGGTVAIATHAGGTKQSADALVLENGATIDLIRNVDGANPEWQWLHHGESYGATYEPSRNVVDPRTGQMKSFEQFLTERGKPVPPYVPLIDSGGGGGGIDHLSGWVVDADKARKKKDQSAMDLFARWIQDRGLPPNEQSLQAFVDANPDWERDGDRIRVKPDALHEYADERAGEWHRAFADEGAGPSWSFTRPRSGTAGSRWCPEGRSRGAAAIDGRPGSGAASEAPPQRSLSLQSSAGPGCSPAV